MTSTLELAFIANIDSGDLLVCSSPDGGQWSNNLQVDQHSGYAPSLALFNTEFWLAFIANNVNGDVLVCSSADGSNWTNNVQVGQRSKAAPALVEFNNGLWLAFLADNDPNNLLICFSPDGVHWDANSAVGQSSKAAPALAVFNGGLWLAFIANNVNGDVLVCSSADGRNWSTNTQVSQFSKAAPALAVFNGRLWLAFIANEDSNDVLVCSSADGAVWTNNTRVGQSSKGEPSLSVMNNELWLAFIANNVNGDVLVCSSADGEHWTGNTPVGQSSKFAPSIVGRELSSGTMRPLYEILTVVYAPPGTNGGKSSSLVDYGKGSTTGTTTSTSSSFKDGIDVNASAGLSFLSGTADFTASTTVTDSSSMQISKARSYDIKVAGPSADGIDHNHDLFYIWLNPLLKVTLDSLNNVIWGIGTDSPGTDNPEMDITYVYVQDLKNPETTEPGARARIQRLINSGLTEEDFATILATNPFTSGGAAIDPDRFEQTEFSFPYEPPLNINDPVPTITSIFTNSIVTMSTHTSQSQYGVSVEVSAGIKEPITAQLKVTGSLEWTNTSSSGTTNGSSQLAAVTIGGPAYGYSGPISVLVYWDTVFSSFMFAFPDKGPGASGTVVGLDGTPIAHEPVTLTIDEKTLRSFTDVRGDYRFYGAPVGRGKILIKDQQFAVAVGPDEPKMTLRLV